MKPFDVVISGAGPAGCTAALSLARNGMRVALIDKAQFPRDKTCGDGVTPASARLLEELGVMEVVRQRVGPLTVFKGITLFSPDGAVVQGRLSQTGDRSSESYVIPRSLLDDCFVTCVKAHESISFFDNTESRELIINGDSARGLSTSGGEFYGKCIVAADGVYSPIAAQLGLLNRQKEQQGFAMRAYFSNVDRLNDSIELHYDNLILPGYGWVFPAGEKRANIGVGIMTRFKEPRGLKNMFERFIAENPVVSSKLKDAAMELGTLKAWPLPFGSFRGMRSQRNVLLAGDAGSFVDPLSGEGIFYALKSGQFAADAIVKALAENDRAQAGALYEKLWRKAFEFDEFSVGYFLQTMLNSRFLMETLLQFASKKQSRADLLADIIAHNRKKLDLVNLLNPLF